MKSKRQGAREGMNAAVITMEGSDTKTIEWRESPMRINHNIPALNAHRILSRNNTNAAGTMERLSSGRRINRAKDDAAGMAISEKMKTQIRGLRKASQNTLDGISLIQTAEGAMNEVHSMLQRMRELAVQSANGTTTDDDRTAIQAEVNQLTSEVNRIANGTEFNTRNLLRGNEAPNTNTVVHRLSTGAPAVVIGSLKEDVDLQSEFLTITIDGQERTVRLNSINEDAGVDNRLEVINNALGELGTAVLLGDEGSTMFEIRTASIGGNSSIEVDGSSTALAAFGLAKGLYTGKAEVDTGNAQGTIYFQGSPATGSPEVGSTITIGNSKIEFYDSTKAPYTGSNRPIDLYNQVTGEYRSTQDIIDIITDMEFPGIESITQDMSQTVVVGMSLDKLDTPIVLPLEDDIVISGLTINGESIAAITFLEGSELDNIVSILQGAIDTVFDGDEHEGVTFTVEVAGKAIKIIADQPGVDLEVEGLEDLGVDDTSVASEPVPRIRFTAEAVGFAGQAVYIEGTPKEFVANLQIGPNQGQGFRLSVGDIRADKLMISATSPDGNTGVTGAAFSQFMEVTDGLSEQKIQYAVDVSNEERSTAAITVYNNAIVQVAQLRGELGAIQNRLEYTSANLDNTMENMTAALSRIEDTDMALEMSEFTKMNIMLQAGTAMLAQANQMPQMVLQLLQ